MPAVVVPNKFRRDEFKERSDSGKVGALVDIATHEALVGAFAE